MKSVKENESILIIKNSKFITQIYKIDTEEKVKEYIELAKEKYPNATHYCYGYILDNIRKESDDGEPSGTAGIPILQVLEKNELNHVLCIVIRYFGKIKLGAGGLLRAYTKSVTTCLENNIIELEKGFIVKLTFSYSITKKVDYILKDNIITNKKFDNDIEYTAIIKEKTLEDLQNLKQELTIEIIKDTYI